MPSPAFPHYLRAGNQFFRDSSRKECRSGGLRVIAENLRSRIQHRPSWVICSDARATKRMQPWWKNHPLFAAPRSLRRNPRRLGGTWFLMCFWLRRIEESGKGLRPAWNKKQTCSHSWSRTSTKIGFKRTMGRSFKRTLFFMSRAAKHSESLHCTMTRDKLDQERTLQPKAGLARINVLSNCNMH